MATYISVSRTNYFRVTDEKRYQELFGNLCSGDELHDFSETKNGVIYHGFGSYSTIDYFIEENEECDFDIFAKELQKILPEDEAFILFEVGNEKLRYITGYATIITRNTYETLSIEDMAIEKAKEILGDDFKTKYTY